MRRKRASVGPRADRKAHLRTNPLRPAVGNINLQQLRLHEHQALSTRPGMENGPYDAGPALSRLVMQQCIVLMNWLLALRLVAVIAAG